MIAITYINKYLQKPATYFLRDFELKTAKKIVSRLKLSNGDSSVDYSFVNDSPYEGRNFLSLDWTKY